jgi:hypothetical protein
MSATRCLAWPGSHVGQQENELVATQSGRRLARRQGFAQMAGDLTQSLVPAPMAIGVVVRFKAVEVEDHKSERRRRFAGSIGTPLLQLVLKSPPV